MKQIIQYMGLWLFVIRKQRQYTGSYHRICQVVGLTLQSPHTQNMLLCIKSPWSQGSKLAHVCKSDTSKISCGLVKIQGYSYLTSLYGLENSGIHIMYGSEFFYQGHLHG
jgi:hypothetical protein